MVQCTTRNSLLCLIILNILLLFIYRFFSSLNPPLQQQQLCSKNFNSPIGPPRGHGNNTSSALKPVVFIGGIPRSGTTLMRAILDSHPMIRCGEETRVIPRILSMRMSWKKSPVEWNRLLAGGMTENILDSAVRAFVYEVLQQHSQAADILCDKDPFVLKYASYISSIFPNSKYLLLVRDARAVIHSIMSRKVTITGFSLTDYAQNLQLWNKGMETMYVQCKEVGPQKCLMVQYEKLVLQPNKTIANILQFLNIPWVEQVLRHEELVGKKISLSKTEHSSAQVVKPINLEGLTKWVGKLPKHVQSSVDRLAPMLKKLGYDTQSPVPSYGTADQLVIDNMDRLKENAEFWNDKAKVYARQ